MTYTIQYLSALGEITVASDGESITGLWFHDQRHFGATLTQSVTDGSSVAVLQKAAHWLDAYFTGNAPAAEALPLAPKGTPFQRDVWHILRKIPYGTTVTYGSIAKRLAAETGRKAMSAQAVGAAVGRNPISILIPCHRVVGTNGQLTGYAGGIHRKEFLLSLETSTK